MRRCFCHDFQSGEAIVAAFGEKSRIDGLWLHDMRHEAVSRFVELRLTKPEVGALNGHRDHRVLQCYAHSILQAIGEKFRFQENPRIEDGGGEGFRRLYELGC